MISPRGFLLQPTLPHQLKARIHSMKIERMVIFPDPP
jgi:hypothetical protein